MTATYKVEIDWNGDGDYADAGEDVTTRVLARSAITAHYGRDVARALSPTVVGEAALDLNNISRDYSPDNTSSPLHGNLGPGRTIRITGTIAATPYVIFQGTLDDYQAVPDRTDRAVHLTCLDGLAKARGVTLSTPIYPAIRTGDAIGHILDAIGWPTGARDLDYGSTVIPWWWEDGTDAWDALTHLLSSEGPPSFITIGPAGEFVFRDRHHRLHRAASITPQATFQDSTVEPRFSSPVGYEAGWKDIINSVTVNVDVRQPSGTVTQVWSSDAVINLTDGETIPVTASGSDPFINAITPEAVVDYTLTSGNVTVALSRTSGASTTIYVTATGGPATVTGMAVRATPLTVIRTVQVHAEETNSIGKYGRRSNPTDIPFAGVHDALAVAEGILAQRAERLPIMTVTLKGSNNTRLTQQLARDLSDRITITETETGTNGDFYIEQISHSIDWNSQLHTTTFACEKAATQPVGVFILNSSLLGTGTLGAIGLDDPAAAFALDSSPLDTGILAH